MWYVLSALSSRRRPGGFTFLVDRRLERDPPLTNAAACRPAALPPARTRPSRLRACMGHTPPGPRPVRSCRRVIAQGRPADGRKQPAGRGKAPQRPRSGLPAATLQAGVAPVDALGVGAYVVVGRQVEEPGHRAHVAVAEQRPDVPRKGDVLIHPFSFLPTSEL